MQVDAVHSTAGVNRPARAHAFFSAVFAVLQQNKQVPCGSLARGHPKGLVNTVLCRRTVAPAPRTVLRYLGSNVVCSIVVAARWLSVWTLRSTVAHHLGQTGPRSRSSCDDDGFDHGLNQATHMHVNPCSCMQQGAASHVRPSPVHAVFCRANGAMHGACMIGSVVPSCNGLSSSASAPLTIITTTINRHHACCSCCLSSM